MLAFHTRKDSLYIFFLLWIEFFVSIYVYIYVYVCLCVRRHFFWALNQTSAFRLFTHQQHAPSQQLYHTVHKLSLIMSSSKVPLCSVETLLSYGCWIGNTSHNLCKNMHATPGWCAVDDSKLKNLWKFAASGWNQSESDCIKVEYINMGLMTSGTEQQRLLCILRLSGRNDSWEILQTFVI